MTDREALVEKAAKAIQEVRWVAVRNSDGSVSSHEADSETLARAALAVFEQAHTPTERIKNGPCWDEGFAFKRPGECDPMPPRCELEAGHLGAHQSGDSTWMHRRTVQGEPSDDEMRAEVERVQKAAWAEIHGQDPMRKYSVGEVKQLVYSFDNVLGSLLARRTVQGETEWEYGNEMLMSNHTQIHPASSEFVAKAQAWLWPMYRRRKAGLWMPVPDTTGAES